VWTGAFERSKFGTNPSAFLIGSEGIFPPTHPFTVSRWEFLGLVEQVFSPYFDVTSRNCDGIDVFVLLHSITIS
jgi:hypothetical protein